MSDPLEEYYIVNLKYAVAALTTIRDLDPGMWRTQKNIAEQALKDMNAGLLSKVNEALEADERELLGGANE
jgi:hypothetical protein